MTNDSSASGSKSAPLDSSKSLPPQRDPTPYCPNCSAEMVPHKCKLECRTPGCGFRVTCTE